MRSHLVLMAAIGAGLMAAACGGPPAPASPPSTRWRARTALYVTDDTAGAVYRLVPPG